MQSSNIAAKALWLLGYPDQALGIGQEGLALAQGLSHPHSLAQVMSCVGMIFQFRREAQATQEQAEAVITLSTEKNMPVALAQGTILKGWAMAKQGQVEEGMAHLRRGLMMHQSLGHTVEHLHFSTLLAEVYMTIGETKEGLHTLLELQGAIPTLYEDYYAAEFYRLKGELLLAQGVSEIEVEACFRQAIEIAQRQKAKSFELRATISLSRFWHSSLSVLYSKQEAKHLLAEIYGWFTEGFDTPDLKVARALIEAMR